MKSEHELAYELDLARKNATRCVGYLKRAIAVDYQDYLDREDEPLEPAQILERQIMELIDGLGDIDSEPNDDSGDGDTGGE